MEFFNIAEVKLGEELDSFKNGIALRMDKNRKRVFDVLILQVSQDINLNVHAEGFAATKNAITDEMRRRATVNYLAAECPKDIGATMSKFKTDRDPPAQKHAKQKGWKNNMFRFYLIAFPFVSINKVSPFSVTFALPSLK